MSYTETAEEWFVIAYRVNTELKDKTVAVFSDTANEKNCVMRGDGIIFSKHVTMFSGTRATISHAVKFAYIMIMLLICIIPLWCSLLAYHIKLAMDADGNFNYENFDKSGFNLFVATSCQHHQIKHIGKSTDDSIHK